MKIPDNIFGRDEENLKKVMDKLNSKNTNLSPIELTDGETDSLEITDNLEIKANIVGYDYIKIPNTNVVIAREETNRNLNWMDTHYALGEKGLFMPAPALFMPYFVSVIEAKQGKRKLYDANNKQLSKKEVNELYNYLTLEENNKGAWTWLDALFLQGSGHNGLDIETDHRLVSPNAKDLSSKRMSLQFCLEKDYVDLNFNSQGLPISASNANEYKRGENIYFWNPLSDRVARFDADSGGSYLDCDRSPRDSDAGLGVFACAEGTQKISGGKP